MYPKLHEVPFHIGLKLSYRYFHLESMFYEKDRIYLKLRSSIYIYIYIYIYNKKRLLKQHSFYPI